MTLPELSIRKPVATTLLALAIVVAGFIGWRTLPIAAIPDIEFPVIQIRATLPGASPPTMEATVARPIERQMQTLPDVLSVVSSSSTGAATVTVQFALERNIDAAALDVQSALSVVQRQLPAQMTTPPSFQKVNPADYSTYIFSIASPIAKLSDLQTIVDTRIVPRISAIPGVGLVNVFGAKKYAVRIRFDPAALALLGLTGEDIRRAVSAASDLAPVGVLGEGKTQFILETTGLPHDAADYADIPIAVRDGQQVRLGDIAEVVDSVENIRSLAMRDGVPGLAIGIQKQPGANMVALADAVEAILPELRAQLPPDAEIRTMVDRSRSAREAVRDAQLTLLGAAILIVIVIFLTLGDVRATLVPSVALPIAAMATFAGMKLLDFTLDNLSLLALTLATGFVVDDAIVVLENIVRKRDSGLAPDAAAIEGSNQIFFTIVSISVSLVAVFIPLLFMGGVIGRMFFEFAVTMTVAVGVSAIIALTLVPMLAARLLRAPGERKHGLAAATTAALDWLRDRYGGALDLALRIPRTILLFTGALVAITAAAFALMPKSFFPLEDTGILQITMRAPPDTSYAEMQRRQDLVAAIVARDPSVEAVNSLVGAGTNVSTGQIYARLAPRHHRPSAEVVMARLRRAMSAVPGIGAYPSVIQDLTIGSRPGSAAYQYTLSAVDPASLYPFARQFEQALRDKAGLLDVISDYQLGAREARFIFDPVLAGQLGVDVSDVRRALYDAFGQGQIATVYAAADSYRVILESSLREQADPASALLMQVRTADGGLTPLANLGRLETRSAPVTISHQAGLPAVTFSFNLPPDMPLSVARERIQAAFAEARAPAGVVGSLQGAAQEFESSLKNQVWLILAAIAIVYVVLGVLYESFRHPVTILSGLPAAALGALGALALFGKPLDVIGVIGIVLLVGIVKKNSIMIVDFALEARRRGVGSRAAIREACLVRFRPIMMTTCAAMAAALPLALGLGAGAALRQPLGIAVAGGLFVSQIVTLFITPVIFSALDGALKRRVLEPVATAAE